MDDNRFLKICQFKEPAGRRPIEDSIIDEYYHLKNRSGKQEQYFLARGRRKR